MVSNVPKDRGWAWMVVLGAFLVNMLVVGVTAKSFGILFKHLKDKLDHSSSSTLFIVAISQCLAMVLGPIANMLVMWFSSRWVVFTGGLLITLGYILSLFAGSIYHLYLSYGVLVGIGSALAYAPSIVTTMQYFDKRKALANGIAVAGGGVGNFAAPPLMQLLLDSYGLSGAFLVLAGMMLHVCLSGALFRPMSFYDRPQTPPPDTGQDRAPTSELSKTKPETCETLCNVDDSKHTDSIHLLENVPCVQQNVPESSRKSSGSRGEGFLDEGYATAAEKSDVTMKSESQESPQTESPRLVSQNGQVARHSQNSLNHSSRCSKLHQKCCCIKRVPARNAPRRQVFEWQLFKNSVFLVYGFSMFFAFSGYPNVFQIILAHAQQKGISKNKAIFLVSIVGIFDVIGRIGFGWFSDLNLIKKKHGFMITMAVAGLACLFMPLAGSSYEGLCILCSIFGLFAGSFYALLPAILVEGLGEKKLLSAFGLVALFMGTAFIYATYVVGVLNDITGQWEESFYFCGVAMVLGALVVLFEPLAVKREARLAAKRELNLKTADTETLQTTEKI